MPEFSATTRREYDSRNLSFFQNPERARQDLRAIRSRLPDQVFAVVVQLLQDSPDPDQSLSLFERLTAQATRETQERLNRNQALLHYAIAIFGHSYWLGETVLRNADILDSLGDEKNLERAFDREQYAERLATFLCGRSEELSILLARFKKREFVRIALRDVLGIATLGETTGEISAVADAIIQEALRATEEQMAARYGPSSPASGFAVLALGKLGGNELNYSSDVDLFFLYMGEESSREEPVSLREYFIREAQLLTGILSQATAEGPVFRIDLRLRPQGREGEIAVSLPHALEYYGRTAQDWELQALIKARRVAGDARLAGTFLRGIQDQVYTEQLNFAAIETALRSRQKMDAGRKRAMHSRGGSGGVDVKFEHGGIRDIEFLTQCLQRVYGGAEPWLRSGGTLLALKKLHEKDHLEAIDFQRLMEAYEFLRRLEHRLQLQYGQQLHRMPNSAADMETLRRALGRTEAHSRSLLRKLRSLLGEVSEIYARIIHNEKHKKQSSFVVPPGADREKVFLDQLLARIGRNDPKFAEALFRADISRHARRGLNRFLTALIGGRESWQRSPTSPSSHDIAVIGKAEARSGSFASRQTDMRETADEDPFLAERILAVLETSEYLTEILVRHPECIRLLREDAARAPRTAAPEREKPAHDLGETMAALRREFRDRMFAAGARDVLAPRGVFDSMRETSHAAEEMITRALQAVDGEENVAVFALGRLGTEEFDIASDADLLFVRDPERDEEQSRVVAEKMVHVLAAYTREGTLFAVDARLRPHGGEGELVVTPAQLERYLADEAQPWEALSYSKIRFVAGRRDLAELVLPWVRRRMVEMGRDPAFAPAVLEMRSRLEKSNRYKNSFKLARGGFYDIDFIASFLMLRRASLHDGNTLERLGYLERRGFLDGSTFATLSEATILFRTTDHVIRLVTGRAVPELPEAEHARDATIKLVNRILQRVSANVDLQVELEGMQEKVRNIFIELIQ